MQEVFYDPKAGCIVRLEKTIENVSQKHVKYTHDVLFPFVPIGFLAVSRFVLMI